MKNDVETPFSLNYRKLSRIDQNRRKFASRQKSDDSGRKIFGQSRLFQNCALNRKK